MKHLFRLFAVVIVLLAAFAFAATPSTQATYHEGNMPRPGCAPGEICALPAASANHEGNMPRPGCAPGEICALPDSNHEGNMPRPGCAPGEICGLR